MPLWLLYAGLAFALAAQGIALLMLASYTRKQQESGKALNRSITTHLGSIQQQERINGERFRSIMNSLDELLRLSRGHAYARVVMNPSPPPPPQNDEEPVRVRSNLQVGSWDELRALAAKERE